MAGQANLDFAPRRFGYDSAFVGTTIARESFETAFGVTPENADNISSNITSAFQAGAFFGAIFCFFCESGHLFLNDTQLSNVSIFVHLLIAATEVTERFGRKWALQINVLTFIVGAIIMTAATHQLSMICTFPIGTPFRRGRKLAAEFPEYPNKVSLQMWVAF